MSVIEQLLSGGDRRSIANSNIVVSHIHDQGDFDELFGYLFHKDRLLVMRAADAVEKATIRNPQYLAKHKEEIIALCHVAGDKELKWHLALLLPRLKLTTDEAGHAWDLLTGWAKDRSNSRIVRVNAVQGLFDLLQQEPELVQDFHLTIQELEKEKIPSVNARIRNLRKLMNRNNSSNTP